MSTKLLYSRKEASQALSLSLRTIDQLIAKNKIQIRRSGSRVLVLAESLNKYAGITEGAAEKNE